MKLPNIKTEAEIYMQKGNTLKECCSIYLAHDIGYNKCLEDIRKLNINTEEDSEAGNSAYTKGL